MINREDSIRGLFQEAMRQNSAQNLLKVSEVENIIGVSKHTVYRLVKTGKIHAIQHMARGDLKFTTAEIERYIKENMTQASGDKNG